MTFRSLTLLFVVALCVRAGDPVAANLAKLGWQAEDNNQIVRAYLLMKEAAARDPKNARYAVSLQQLAPKAKLLMDAHVESADDISDDVKKAQAEPAEPGLDQQLASMTLTPEDERQMEKLLPPPTPRSNGKRLSFNIHADSRSILTDVATAYGLQIIFDPSFQVEPNLHFEISNADLYTALDAATLATGSFVFPVSSTGMFAANDNEAKRTQFEPEIMLTVPLPNALDPKEVVEAANAVRGAIGLRGTIAWDSAARSIVIRDHISKARAARSVLEAVLLPRAQVSFDVQLLAIDSDTNYTYGIAPQTAFQVAAIGLLTRLHNVSIPSLVTGTTFLPFGGGASLLGIGLADARLFANYNQSTSHVLYDATLNVSDGQSASLHVGDKYPIPTAIFSGYTQTSGSAAYNPIGQVQQEDLGLTLKVSPHIKSDGSVFLDLESEYRTLGNTQIDSVPAINQRSFKGTVTVAEGQWAIVAGMQDDERSVAKSGLAGLGDLPGLGNLFAQTSRTRTTSNTLVVLKPTITRLPMKAEISPQYLLGPEHGQRVLF